MNVRNLGNLTVSQKTINSKVDEKKIFDFLYDKIDFIKKTIETTKDIHLKDLFNFFLKEKKFPFSINKHEEIYISKNYNNFLKIVNYLNHRYKFFLCSRKKIDLGYPPYLLIEPVSTCNFKCPFCFQTDKSFTKKPYMGTMDLKLFKKVVDEADQIGIGAVTLASRGEPTLHKNFKFMLEYLNTKKNIFEIKINSNGSFLTEEKCHAIFKNNVTQIVISADHYEKKEFEKLRLGSKFEKIVSNVDMLFNIRKEFYSDAPTEIRISGVDNDKNLDRKKFEQFWISRSDHVSAGFPLERWNTYENTIHKDIFDPCENLWDRMYVWFDGKVNPCDADYKSYLSYGDVSSSTILEVWENEKIKRIREDHLNGSRLKHNPCDRCGSTFV